ncbi:hypothetical protein ACFL96_08665 [Thermoproteota archaeon]
MADETKRVNCTSCNKQLLRIKRYYRDNKYYCNKNCHKTFQKKQAESKE